MIGTKIENVYIEFLSYSVHLYDENNRSIDIITIKAISNETIVF
jgi:hypothetical protein